MNKKFKKIIAPVIITILLIIWFIGYLTIWACAPISSHVRITGIIVFLILKIVEILLAL